jgi:hypothetical protein
MGWCRPSAVFRSLRYSLRYLVGRAGKCKCNGGIREWPDVRCVRSRSARCSIWCRRFGRVEHARRVGGRDRAPHQLRRRRPLRQFRGCARRVRADPPLNERRAGPACRGADSSGYSTLPLWDAASLERDRFPRGITDLAWLATGSTRRGCTPSVRAVLPSLIAIAQVTTFRLRRGRDG